MKDTETRASGYEKPDKKCKKDKYWMVTQSHKAQEMSEKIWRESKYYRAEDLRESRARRKDNV
jgi:hypothetical protein